MAVLISQSASTVKKPTKNSVQFKATKKLLVEDDTHEAEVARGELFYLDETKAGCFLYDPDPSGVFYKFKITKKVFKQLSKEHTLVVREQKPRPKKPTPAKPSARKPKSNSFDPQDFLDTKPKQNRIVKEAMTMARKLGFDASITVDELGSGEWVYLSMTPKGKPSLEGLLTLRSPTSPPVNGNFRIRVNRATVPVVDDVYPAGGFEGAIKRLVAELSKYAKKGGKKGEKLFMAYNHNGTPLMNEPGTYEQAEKEARDYDTATGNGSYVDEA